MSSVRCKVLLCLFAVTWILFPKSTNAARNDRRCNDLLRRLLRNPPNNIKIAINIALSKARYICHEGFKLVGKEVRTYKGGKWRENVEPTCLKPCGKPENIPHSKVVGSSFNFNDPLRYECVKGYTLSGPRLRTCGNDGKWSEAPRCEEIIPCGQSLVNARAKIVGGTISQRGMWPWQIAIYRINKNVPQFSCGGALVSRRWVLTAAHCFYDVRGVFIGNANLYLIKAGYHVLSVNETLQQQVVPKRIFVHPIFKPSGLPFFDGDIALIKLTQEVEFNKFVRTVCLPDKILGDLAILNTRGTVAGWGVTRPLRRGEFAHFSEISKVLRHVSFPIQSDQLCINKSGIQFNTTTAFCAGDGRGGDDACQGDSGGAFVRELGNSKWVVIGVVSWGNGCAQKDQYGYYTRIHPFLDWIKETMNEKKEPENNKPANQCSSESTKQQRRRGINLNEDCGLDLVFLFDASVRVNKFFFQTSLEFAKELLTVIGASKRSVRTQVAAVTEAKLEFNLGDSKVDTIDKAIKAIDNIMYVGWVSSYIRPFKLVRNKVAPNFRKDSHQVLMFITDGLDLSGSVQREAKYLRDNEHFEVYAIGIGRKVKTRALMSVASANEDHNHVISVRRYRNLQEAVQRVVHVDIVPASCQSPGGIAHGKKFGSDYSHNKTVRYECDAEYTLEGKKKLTCNDGKWNYSPPRCKASCSNPGSPINGTMQRNNFSHNSWVTFSCNQNYHLNGNDRIKCNDGTWIGSVPVCIAMCPDPGVPKNGMRLRENFQDGKTVTFACKKYYDLLGNATLRCNGGVWNSEKPKCKGRCAFVGTPDNGYTVNGIFVTGQLLPHSSNVEYICDVSYTLVGSKVLHCDGGSWNAKLPSCKASCQSPGGIAQGKMIGTDYRHGKTVRYKCDAEYVLEGKNRLTCNDGKWNYNRPRCKDYGETGIDLNANIGLDLVFVIDSTSSIRRTDFSTGLRFAKTLVRTIGASKRSVRTRIAAVSFGFETRLEFNLGETKVDTMEKVIEAIDKIKYIGGATGPKLAFRMVRNEVESLARVDSHRVMMFITDGISNIDGPSQKEATYLRERGKFEIYAIAVGNKLRIRELMGIASVEEHNDHVISVKKYKNLQESVKKAVYAEIDYSPCGESPVDFRARMVGGKSSGKGWWPWQIGLYKRDIFQGHDLFRIVGKRPHWKSWETRLMVPLSRGSIGRRLGVLDKGPFHLAVIVNPKTEVWYNKQQLGVNEHRPGLQLICGGALISRRWILTAASCFYHFQPIFGQYRFRSNPAEYLVKAGDHNLKRRERSEQDIYPERFFVHEDYVDRKFMNDIALIKLREKVKLSPFARTLCLPEKDEGDLAIPMKYGFVTGWGVTQALKYNERPKPQSRYSTRLQYSAFTIQGGQQCANRSVIAFNSTVTFCAGDGKGGNDTCHGDSGGAFVRKGKRGEDYRWVATGLVSWGLGCAQKNQYGYYTRVYPFTDWINNTIKENTEPGD